MRQFVMVKVSAAELTAVNAYLADLFGDDPGSQEVSVPAYLDGGDPHTATHYWSNMNVSQADANSIAAELPNHADCDQRHRDLNLGSWGWDDLLLVWGLKPVVPVTP